MCLTPASLEINGKDPKILKLELTCDAALTLRQNGARWEIQAERQRVKGWSHGDTISCCWGGKV